MSSASPEELSRLTEILAGAAGAIPFAHAVASQLFGAAGSHGRADPESRARVVNQLAHLLLRAGDDANGDPAARELFRNPELASAMFQNLDLLYQHRYERADAVSAALLRVLELAASDPHPPGEPIMRVERVLESCLYAEELAAATRFYEEVLGLEILSSAPGRHTFFRSGPGMFLLFNPRRTSDIGGEVPGHGAQGPGHVAFAIDERDLPQWRTWLIRHGVSIEAEVTWPRGGSSLYVRDPAGNSVELTSPAIWGL